MKDTVNVGFEKNTYGFLITAFFTFGILYVENGKGFGLRHGHFGKYLSGGEIWFADHRLGTNYLYFHSSFQHIAISPTKRNKNRVIKYYMSGISKGTKTILLKKGREFLPTFGVVLGSHYAFRFEINMTEVFDLCSGFFGYDLVNDDLKKNGNFGWEDIEREKLVHYLQVYAEVIKKFNSNQELNEVENDIFESYSQKYGIEYWKIKK
ncbi:MAG: hypothetical protein SFU98_15975 [Leptospiraceae bacterium]|nr:hypothetical protein [Leptospiraceae bacterium]